MWIVARIFCRPGISHLAVYFICESSGALEKKCENSMNHIKFRGSCFYITYNIRSFHFLGNCEVRFQRTGMSAFSWSITYVPNNVSGLLNHFKKSPITKVIIPEVRSFPWTCANLTCLRFFQTITWNENIIGYLYKDTLIE